MLISNECVVNFPVLSATFTVMATNDALRFLQLSELTATPNFHCISTSYKTEQIIYMFIYFGENCILFENLPASIVDLMVRNFSLLVSY